VNGELAQLAALVAQGNAWLGGDHAAAARITSGSTFQYVRSFGFRHRAGRLVKRTVVETTAEAWLEGLRRRGAAALWLDPRMSGSGPMPTRMAAAFANGARASIVALGPATERWWASWTVVGRPTPEDQRIWAVDYDGEPDPMAVPEPRDVPRHLNELRERVRAAADLAGRAGWPMWVDWLEAALAAAASDAPVARFHDDVLPPGAGVERRRLFALVSGAWVFGGMGSWNDMGTVPELNDEYERVSQDLFEAITEGVAAAVNPSGQP